MEARGTGGRRRENVKEGEKSGGGGEACVSGGIKRSGEAGDAGAGGTSVGRMT